MGGMNSTYRRIKVLKGTPEYDMRLFDEQNLIFFIQFLILWRKP